MLKKFVEKKLSKIIDQIIGSTTYLGLGQRNGHKYFSLFFKDL